MLTVKNATISLLVMQGGDEMFTTNDVTISLGKPVTVPVLIPVQHTSTPTCIAQPFMINGECHKVTALSFGTPHGAVFVDDLNGTDVPSLGHALGTHVLFPEGASIVFIQMQDKESLKARLWQRDEGELPFSPEAACVAGTAAMMCQKVLFNEANVTMGGNTFRMKWDRIGDGVTLSLKGTIQTHFSNCELSGAA